MGCGALACWSIGGDDEFVAWAPAVGGGSIEDGEVWVGCEGAVKVGIGERGIDGGEACAGVLW